MAGIKPWTFDVFFVPSDCLEFTADFCCHWRMKRLFPVFCFLFLLIAARSLAGSATWSNNPTSGDWNTAANWIPATVPNGPTDTATFSLSDQTEVSVGSSTEVNGINFNSGANPFIISLTPGQTYSVSGAGVVNNSNLSQSFALTPTTSGSGSVLIFTNSATAGSLTSYTIGYGNKAQFQDTTTAGGSTFTMNGGFLFFNESSTAAQATFILNGSDTLPDELSFTSTTTSGGTATFIINGTGGKAGNVCGMGGNAQAAVFTANGAIDTAHGPGQVVFGIAGSATVTANPGTNGGAGGLVFFNDSNDVNTARIILVGSTNGGSDSGTLDVELGGVTIGSFEGNGVVKVGGGLTVGANNLSTTFSGLIEGGSNGHIGPFIKTGTGTLTLKGPNTYPAGTTINSGTLVVANKTGSGTGSANVYVNGGTLAGTGIISGPVSIGGSTTAAVLSPGIGKRPGTLTLSNLVTFASRSRFRVSLNSDTGVASQLKARRVMVTSDATVSLGDLGSTALPTGTVFTIISNTDAPPISGRFANLADGATITVGSNTYQANYEGGDGNDLTLTVVP
jgi:autotransporter-associated beta strand protein